MLGQFLSGRPGSNRPPRPWQGRALPNELLPLVRGSSSFHKKNFKYYFKLELKATFFSDGKNKGCTATTKIFYLYFGLYRVFSGTFTSGFPL